MSKAGSVTETEATSTHLTLTLTLTLVGGNVYALDETNIRAWDIVSVGAYRREQGAGELVLSTKHLNRHTNNKPGNKQEKRRFWRNGLLFYHTRDIVQASKEG